MAKPGPTSFITWPQCPPDQPAAGSEGRFSPTAGGPRQQPAHTNSYNVSAVSLFKTTSEFLSRWHLHEAGKTGLLPGPQGRSPEGMTATYSPGRQQACAGLRTLASHSLPSGPTSHVSRGALRAIHGSLRHSDSPFALFPT